MSISGSINNTPTQYTLQSNEHAFFLKQTDKDCPFTIQVLSKDRSYLVAVVDNIAQEKVLGLVDGQIRWDGSSKQLLFDQEPFSYDETVHLLNGQTSLEVLSSLGEAWLLRGEYVEAQRFYEQCLELSKDSIEQTQFRLYVTLGQISHALSEYSHAIDLYDKALFLLGEPSTLEVISVYDDRGSVYQALGKYNKALDDHEMALELKKKMCADTSPEIAITLTHLGIDWCSRGDFEKGFNFFEKALKTFEQTDNSHPSYYFVTHLLHYMGVFAMHKKDFRGALVALNKALKFKKNHYHYRYLDQITISRVARGAIYLRMGNLGKAMKDLQKAKTYLEVAFDKLPHSETAKAHLELGNVWYAYEDFLTAKEHYLKASAMLKDLFGNAQHPEKVRCWNNLGCVYLKLKNPKLAKEYFFKVDEATKRKSQPLKKRNII